MIGNIMDERFVAGHRRRAATRASVHHSITKTVFDVLLKNGDLTVSIATIVSKYVKNKSR